MSKDLYKTDAFKELSAHSAYIGISNYFNGSEDIPDTQIWVFTFESILELVKHLNKEYIG